MNLISCNEESSNLKQELHLSPPKLPKAGIDNTYNSPTKNNRMSNFLMAQKTNSPHGNGYFEIFKKLFENDENTYMEKQGLMLKVFHTKLKMIEWSRFVLIIIGWGLCILEYYNEFYDYTPYEIDYENKKKNTDLISLCLLWLIFITNVILILFTILFYDRQLNFSKMVGFYGKYETMFSTGRLKYLLLEILILSIIPQHFLYKQKIEFFNTVAERNCFYYANDILHLLMMMRVVIVVKILLNNTYWNSHRAARVCSMYCEECDYLFALKCLMKEKPMSFVSISGALSILYFGYALTLCEGPVGRPYFDSNGLYTSDSSNNMQIIENSMWVVILTMTTVGYGDFYPRTIAGRIVAFLVCVWGVYIVSLTVYALNNILTPTKLESKAIAVLGKLKAKVLLYETAKAVIGEILKLKMISKIKRKKLAVDKNESKLRSKLNAFKFAKKNYKSIEDEGNLEEAIQRNYLNLRFEINTIKINQKIFFDTQIEIMKQLKIKENKISNLAGKYQYNQWKNTRGLTDNFESFSEMQKKNSVKSKSLNLNEDEMGETSEKHSEFKLELEKSYKK